MYILHSKELNQKIKLTKDIIIGRKEINDSSVSLGHIKIHYEEDKVFIEDLSSTHGTFINDNKIQPNTLYELKKSQKIRLGKISYFIEYELEKNIDKEFIIGRDPKADIWIDSSSVSFHHIKIVKENDMWFVLDNNSTNGTYLNSYVNKIDKVPLEENQVLYLASYKLNTNEIFNLFNKDKKIAKVINNDVTSLGRNPKSTIIIDNFSASWNHAKIVKKDSLYYIYDLNSTNGTYVNALRVEKSMEIKADDKITLGLYSFIFQENSKDSLSLLNINRNGFRVDVKDVFFEVNKNTSKEKTLLNKISFTIYPGEIVGIMGLSGAGKTTLLKILSGYSQPTRGDVSVNGLDLYKSFHRIKNSIGYVPQEDIIHPELTVYQSLLYSLKLRIDDIPIEQINSRIDNILDDLGIAETRDVIIGSPDEKGISGGQRKRVNIAMELLADPELIFLDEPTSGLSSVDAKVVMEKLKELSDAGKTILLTIHQPSLINYKKMDNMIILTKGNLAYFGPTYPDSIKFFNENSTSQDILNDPDMALLGLYDGEKKNINWTEKYEKSDIYTKFVKDRASKNDHSENFDTKSSSSFKQLKTLSQRYLKIKIKDKVNTAILLIQAPLIAMLLAFLFAGEGAEFNKEKPSILLFIMVISAMWFGIINSVKEIVFEKAIYERERLIGLKLMPYLMSKFLILMILSFVQVLMLILIVNIFVPLDLNIEYLILVIFLTALTGVSLGLLTSTISKSVSQALALVPIVLLPMIIFGGGMMPIKDVPTNKFYLDAYRVSLMMPTRWALEEVIRIYDTQDDNSSTPLREPVEANNEINKLIYMNKDVQKLVIEGYDEALCEDRRCIEALYIKENKDEKWIFKTNSTFRIYSILLLFIMLPLFFIVIILKIRDKKR